MSDRRTGITTAQMQKAPAGAVFIWVTGSLSYPKALAAALGRTDLRIESPEWLERSFGLRVPGLIIDHAARLTERQMRMAEVLAVHIQRVEA